MIEEFKAQHKIDVLFKLHTEGVGSPITFGWVETDYLDLSVPLVVSYPSSSKKMSEEDIKEAKAVGRNAATFDDYHQYFFWLTGTQPSEFLELWPTLEHMAASSKYTARQSEFLWKLAKFLVDKKSFYVLGRGFKLVEYKDEERNQTTEVRPEEEGGVQAAG